MRGSRDKWLFSFSMSVVRLDETNCEVLNVVDEVEACARTGWVGATQSQYNTETYN